MSSTTNERNNFPAQETQVNTFDAENNSGSPIIMFANGSNTENTSTATDESVNVVALAEGHIERNNFLMPMNFTDRLQFVSLFPGVNIPRASILNHRNEVHTDHSANGRQTLLSRIRSAELPSATASTNSNRVNNSNRSFASDMLNNNIRHQLANAHRVNFATNQVLHFNVRMNPEFNIANTFYQLSLRPQTQILENNFSGAGDYNYSDYLP